MSESTLINCHKLTDNLANPNWVVFDCRFSLNEPEAGHRNYRFGHIPNARYVHLDHDLSSERTDRTGRHPLPNFAQLAKKLGLWGVDNNTQIIVYDDANGSIAARMWWLIKCLGHDHVALLDGGFQNWKKQGYRVSINLPKFKPKSFRAYPTNYRWLNAENLHNALARRSICLIDARTSERFEGLQEPIDPIAGHIPGAVNRAFQLNLETTGCFKSSDTLRHEFLGLLGQFTSEQAVHMCGSGVTACHNLLAMEIAGLTGSMLYPGSWSEWIRDKNRPLESINR